MGQADAGMPADKLELYEKLVATNPSVERKGASMPYTSTNGHMFSFLSKTGKLAIRLPTEERDGLCATVAWWEIHSKYDNQDPRAVARRRQIVGALTGAALGGGFLTVFAQFQSADNLFNLAVLGAPFAGAFGGLVTAMLLASRIEESDSYDDTDS